LWEPPAVRTADRASYTPEELGPPAMEFTLHAGDVLYLPRHTPHAAVAKAELSLHLSVTVEPRRWRDLVAGTVGDLLGDDRFEGFPYLGDGERPEAADRLARLLAELADRIAAVDPVAELRRLAAAGRAGEAARPREFQRLAAVDSLTADVRLRRGAVPVELGESEGGRTGLTVGGHRLAVPDAVATAVRRLEDGGMVRAAEFFPGVPRDRSLRAAQGLARLGVLEAVPQGAGETAGPILTRS
jgi:hypothetical protein